MRKLLMGRGLETYEKLKAQVADYEGVAGA